MAGGLGHAGARGCRGGRPGLGWTGAGVPQQRGTDAFLGSQVAARGPQFLGSGTGWAMGPRLSVGLGLGLGGGEVVGGPVSGAAVVAGVLVGSSFQRADACSGGPIIPWHARRREQWNHRPE